MVDNTISAPAGIQPMATKVRDVGTTIDNLMLELEGESKKLRVTGSGAAADAFEQAIQIWRRSGGQEVTRNMAVAKASNDYHTEMHNFDNAASRLV